MARRFVVLLAVTAVAAGAAVPLAAEFDRDIRPIVTQYCLVCHSAAKHAGDLNLERYSSFAAVMNDPKPWQKAVEQLTLGEMPPKGMPPLPAAEKARLLTWIQGALQAAAQARAGDPGPVVLRRLNNAEYTYTVRDLMHVASLDPVREFPVDGAAGEGFMNTGGALAMSPALLSKYLDAGKSVAAHTADGGADTVTQQGIALDKNRGGTLPLDRYFGIRVAGVAVFRQQREDAGFKEAGGGGGLRQEGEKGERGPTRTPSARGFVHLRTSG